MKNKIFIYNLSKAELLLFLRNSVINVVIIKLIPYYHMLKKILLGIIKERIKNKME